MKKRGKKGRGRPPKKTPKPKFSTKASRKEEEARSCSTKSLSQKIAHISRTLQDELMIAPTAHATLGKVRKYLIAKNLIQKKINMSITEENLVSKWRELVGEQTTFSEEEVDSEEFL